MSTATELKQPSIAEQMMRLFPASQRAHATYILDESTHQRRDRDGKSVAEAMAVAEGMVSSRLMVYRLIAALERGGE